jgi:hypothetical protein
VNAGENSAGGVEMSVRCHQGHTSSVKFLIVRIWRAIFGGLNYFCAISCDITT